MQFVTNQGRPHVLLKPAKWLGIGAVGLFALIGAGTVLGPAPAAKAPAVASSQPAPSAQPEASAEDTAAVTSDAAAAADAQDASASSKPSQASGGVDYLALKLASESQLDAKLTDSHGVRYQNVMTSLTILDGAAIVAFCGEENGKTPMGGYGGFQRFIASQSTAITEADMTVDDFDRAWRQFCGGAPGPKVWF